MASAKPIEICIPKVSVKIPRKTIFETFCKLKIGYINKITENLLRTDPNYKRIIIHIKWDNSNPLAKEIQATLQGPNHMNIVYDMPWFWQIYANQTQTSRRDILQDAIHIPST
jgi:hypothetical protein